MICRSELEGSSTEKLKIPVNFLNVAGLNLAQSLLHQVIF